MTTSSYFELRRGESPLIISIPHLGREIPEDIRSEYSEQAFLLEDTDWHLDQLYEFASELDATVLSARISRYVVDLNRPASGESLYPGMTTTSLCPSETFRGVPLYAGGQAPQPEEIDKRVEKYWRPYHTALRDEIARLRLTHKHVLLWEAHSIASHLPRLFPGKLPDFNFGSSDGQSCAESIAIQAISAVKGSRFSWVLNGRFKGGYITRRYGQPQDGVHAVQLELCQSTYMDEESPFRFRQELAERTAPVIRAAISNALEQVAVLNTSENV